MILTRRVKSGCSIDALSLSLSRVSSSSSHPSHLSLIPDVISKVEERELCEYITSLLKRKRYEGEHWDSVISKYKEMELHEGVQIPLRVNTILKRVENVIKDSYKAKVSLMNPHIIDLDACGRIGSHVDSVKHSGGVLLWPVAIKHQGFEART